MKIDLKTIELLEIYTLYRDSCCKLYSLFYTHEVVNIWLRVGNFKSNILSVQFVLIRYWYFVRNKWIDVFTWTQNGFSFSLCHFSTTLLSFLRTIGGETPFRHDDRASVILLHCSNCAPSVYIIILLMNGGKRWKVTRPFCDKQKTT